MRTLPGDPGRDFAAICFVGILACGALAAVSQMACNDHVSVPVAVPVTTAPLVPAGPPPIARIELAPADTARTVGDLQPFRPSCIDVNNVNVPCPALSWSSSDTLAVTIDATVGLARARRAGSVTIGARIATGLVTGTTRFRVIAP